MTYVSFLLSALEPDGHTSYYIVSEDAWTAEGILLPPGTEIIPLRKDEGDSVVVEFNGEEENLSGTILVSPYPPTEEEV